MGLLERNSKTGTAPSAPIVATTSKRVLQPIVKAEVEAGASVYTDANYSYEGLSARFLVQHDLTLLLLPAREKLAGDPKHHQVERQNVRIF